MGAPLSRHRLWRSSSASPLRYHAVMRFTQHLLSAIPNAGELEFSIEYDSNVTEEARRLFAPILEVRDGPVGTARPDSLGAFSDSRQPDGHHGISRERTAGSRSASSRSTSG